jgi:hypothetical protein
MIRSLRTDRRSMNVELPYCSSLFEETSSLVRSSAMVADDKLEVRFEASSPAQSRFVAPAQK